MCDASAAVALDSTHFAVANDEDNPLRIYSCEQGSMPLQSFDFSKSLGVDARKPEMDIEGGCWLEDKIFWITSHGRNKDGEYRSSRHFLFATTCKKTAKGFEMKLFGRPYQTLSEDLAREPRFKSFGFAQASQLAPKVPGALNIEGLCATPDKKLLIAFRNPTPNSKALLIPLNNPDQVVLGRKAQFGEPVLLALGGLGIRDIAQWRGQYLLIAGAVAGKGESHLYGWVGGDASPQLFEWSKHIDFNPEAIIVYADDRAPFQLLSDDGARRVGNVQCKDLPDPRQRRFRSYWVNLTETNR